MENKKLKSLSMVALIVSLLPTATLIPVFLKIVLSDGVRTVWAGANIVFVLLGLLLSVICVRSEESRNIVNIISTVVSALWLLMMAGILAPALFLNFVQ